VCIREMDSHDKNVHTHFQRKKEKEGEEKHLKSKNMFA
jgi:hypothetical protein